MVDVEVGSVAPEMALPLHHRPRVLAFVERWESALERRVLARVRDLEAEVVIVHGDGAWSFEHERLPMFAGEASELRAQFRVQGDALFVVDHRGVVRFAHHGGVEMLAEAMAAAIEALDERRHHSLLERVQFTAREWATQCLVVGFALTFQSAPRPRRFARGTEPVCTARAAIGAQTPQLSGIGEWPSTLSPRRVGE
jgi:hypothetical protein